jgi:PAS domain S-box-containing protein
VPADAATIVIVDDSSEVRLLIRTRLRMSGALRVVGEGADGADAISLAEQHQPSLMLLDVSMPRLDGLEALPQVLAVSPGTRVVMYTGFEERGLVDKARQLGAAAFLEKSAPVDDLIDRLLAVTGADTVRDPRGPRAEETRPARGPLATSAVDQKILAEHQERFREVFEEAAIGMATMTLTGHLVRTNRALAALVQRTQSDLLGRFYGDLTQGREEALRTALEDINRRSLDVVQLEHGLTDASDDRRLQTTFAPVRDSRGRPLYVFLQVQDVTAERAAAEELRRSEERFRLLVAAVEDYAIFMLDPTGHIVSWNAGAQRSKGYTSEEIIGQHFRVFYPPEERARQHPEHELRVALSEGHYEEEGWRLRKDGSRFWANVLITSVFNDAGEHIGFAKVTRDTTERRQALEERDRAAQALATANTELESLNRQLQRSTDDQAQFLAVTAHELRTPIGVLSGSADLLSQHWSELSEEERDGLLQAMTTGTTRLRRLLDDLLTASRLQASALEIRPAVVPVGDVAREAVTSARRTHPEAEIVLDVPPGITVHADRDRLAQALDNLLDNALHHGAPPVRVRAASGPGGVQIRVSDEGPGVSSAIQPRLFDRFATGRQRGGTGLGLFIVRELARAQGGDAFYEPASAQTSGGTFVIVLPDGSLPRAASPSQPVPGSRARRGAPEA